MILQGLAAKPENLDRILSKLKESGIDEGEKQSLLQGIVAASHRNADAKEAVWKLYDAEPSLQKTLLQQMAFQGDARAKGIVTDQLRSGRLSDELVMSLGNLASMDRKWGRENADAFRGLLSSAATPTVRSGAFQALAQVDRPGAVQGLMAVFNRLSETERIASAQQLQYGGGKEGREALQGIAVRDPSEQVRKAAEAALGGGSAGAVGGFGVGP